MEAIILTKERAVATIRLNQPDLRNALTTQLKEELAVALEDVARDDATRAVIITGTGKAFCAGGDLKRLSSGNASPIVHRASIDRMNHIVLSLASLDKPVIAAVNGAASGAGCSLAFAADIVLAAESARFSQAFVRVGLAPDAGTSYFLPRLVGLWKAKEMIFTGDPIDAREAERLGLVNRVFPDGDLELAARALAERLARGPAGALAAAKRTLNRSLSLDLATVLELEANAQTILLTSDDFAEGARAFFEKRPPTFTGD